MNEWFVRMYVVHIRFSTGSSHENEFDDVEIGEGSFGASVYRAGVDCVEDVFDDLLAFPVIGDF